MAQPCPASQGLPAPQGHTPAPVWSPTHAPPARCCTMVLNDQEDLVSPSTVCGWLPDSLVSEADGGPVHLPSLKWLRTRSKMSQKITSHLSDSPERQNDLPKVTQLQWRGQKQGKAWSRLPPTRCWGSAKLGSRGPGVCWGGSGPRRGLGQIRGRGLHRGA